MILLLFSTILLLGWPLLGLGIAPTTTFELRFDGRVTSLRGEDAAPSDASSSVAGSFAPDLSMGISTDILYCYCNLTDCSPSLENATIEHEQQPCFHHGAIISCLVNHHDVTDDGRMLTLQVVTHVSSDFSTRLDVSLTASEGDNVVRQSLVRALPKIRKRLAFDMTNGITDSSVWSISHRPNAMQLQITETDPSTREDRDTKAASVESIVLGNAEMRNRVQLEYAFVDGLPNTSQSRLIELWEYNDLYLKDPVKSLFINGKLQTTTAPAGAAHAEALAHPALIAHSTPKDVAVLSQTPSALVREVLKHTSVERVTVIGTDVTALDMVTRNMPRHNDCNFFETRTDDPNCMSRESVEIVHQNVKEWLDSCRNDISKNGDSSTCYYDVILVDVPIGTHEWLSPDLYGHLQWLCRKETVIVVSSGSQPRLSDVNGDVGMNARDTLLYQASRKEAHGGIEYDTVLVYDEPLAQPLSSTFIALFYSNEEETYSRFVRKNSPAIDIDIVNRLYPMIASPPTLVYDGSTHRGYMTTSKAWEHWFCRTSPWKDSSICEFASNWMNPVYHHFGLEVRQDKVKGRTVYATEDVPKGHFINSNDAATSWRLEQDVINALVRFVEDYPGAEMYKQLLDFLQAYGFTQKGIGIDGFGVSLASINTFINHACSKDVERVTCLSMVDNDGEEPGFSPPFARRVEVIQQLAVASQDIRVGEEILQDYSTFRPESDQAYKTYLKEMCETGLGLVPRDDGDENSSTCTL